MNRRGFLAGLASAIAAPAIVRPGLLMPVRPVPPSLAPWRLPIAYASVPITATEILAKEAAFERWIDETVRRQFLAELAFRSETSNRRAETIRFPGL